MANTPTPEDIQELKELANILNKGINLNNLIQDANLFYDTLKNWRKELIEAEGGFINLSKTLKNILKDFGKIGDISKDVNKSYNKLDSYVTKLKYDQQGISKLSSSELEKLKYKINIEVDNLKILKDQLQLKYDNNTASDEELNRLFELTGLFDEQNNLTKDYANYLNTIIDLTDERIKQQKKLEVLDALKDKFRIKEIKDMLTLAGLFKIMLDATFRFNTISVNIGKNLGYGADNADRVTQNLIQISNNSSNLNVTLKNLDEAMNDLNTATGGVAEYSSDTLQTQIMLTKQLGLAGEEAAGIYKFSVLSGKASSQINDEIAGAFASTRNLVKGSANFKTTMAEVAKTSGQLAINFKNNPSEIAKAIVQAQALGTTLEQVKSQGRQLLDFESSISNELEAELLTGQQINLERARAAALMGDQVTVMKELANQGMTLEKFQNMNVLAQESFAKALGLSADQLSEQLRKQKIAQEQGKSLEQITKEEALEAEKRQAVQDKFNAAIEKLQDIIGNLVAGPFGSLLEALSNALNIVGLIGKPFSAIGYIIDNITGSAKGLASVLKGILGIAAAVWTFINPVQALASLALAGVVVAGAQALIPGENKFATGGIVTGEINNATIGEAGPEAVIPLNSPKADKMLGGPNIDLTPMIAAINQVKASVDKLYAKDTTINMDGKRVGTTLTQGSYKVA